ncbi:hypothetical protein BigBertha_134 [Bacillus phage BigBertha]|uniref:Uncharacterized protein n=4 Tax=Bequatrovirus TaxID=1917990 RepID=A0A7U3T8R1_9CAUD|nr:hypothetical protein TROLL_140 [Bacillus phage Troll]YP_008771161.1 hypothetical protein BigBertha_134 [Bacillus phage BigBertha]YP_009290014.1 hypothetical protein BI003_gp135 [Bacillus phage Phrodo]AMW61663.1 hypothetical protein JUGLONE_137 [Bacillus phage Juglone]QDH49832.1 hypothetical protein BEYONPHE_145 [Bacillus phage Beyonphe]QPY77371.1 hypothetical protein ANTHOS_135 [Bacillus phage Anthos]UGO48947.1 hypothetical protein JARJAR_133 [Bacillus phage vB_BanH_JarJar]UGO50437.1 hypo
MSRKRILNVYNTDRSKNVNLTTAQKEGDAIKVTRLNEEELEAAMTELENKSELFPVRDDNKYLVFKQKYGNDTLQDKIFKHGGFVQYYSTGKAPVPVITSLAQVPQSEIIYACQKEHTLEDVKNVQLSSMATSVVIDVPIVLPDINVYDYLFSLYPLRYHVDKVRVSFPALAKEEIQDRHKKYYRLRNGKYYMKPEYKYECFCHLQDPLSTWKMNIWLVCDDERDKKKVDELIEKDNKKFKYTNHVSLMEGC